MIRFFLANDKSFSSNGEKVCQPYKCISHYSIQMDDNYLSIETPIEYSEWMIDNNIVVAGGQAYRLNNVEKRRTKIVSKAYPVYMDAKNYLIADSFVVEKNCNQALNHLNDATTPTSDFSMMSNITGTGSYRCVRKSLFDAVKEVQNRWGGMFTYDNFTIKLLSSLGSDKGVTIRYGKNLVDISCKTNWNDVVTKLMPVGNDGIMLENTYITSSTTYDIPYTKMVKFEQNIAREDYESESDYISAVRTELAQQGQNYLDENCVPKVTYTLSASVNDVQLGDTIEVIDELLGINILTQVIAYDYNHLTGEYTNVQFGNFTPKLQNLISTLNEQAESIAEQKTTEVSDRLTISLNQATANIMSILNDSYIVNTGSEIYVCDRLPKESAVNVIRINSRGIGFSQTGITGTFNSAWQINGTLDMQQINVINLVADLIKGGTLKLGSNLNESGVLEIYDNANNLIGQIDSNGLKMYGQDGGYVLLNTTVGFAGYDAQNTKIYWVDADEFHQKKSVVEEEITLCNKVRFIPITIEQNNTVVNDGIGLVSVQGV